jgi:hypothetical protein
MAQWWTAAYIVLSLCLRVAVLCNGSGNFPLAWLLHIVVVQNLTMLPISLLAGPLPLVAINSGNPTGAADAETHFRYVINSTCCCSCKASQLLHISL